jgi:hypothetical protein
LPCVAEFCTTNGHLSADFMMETSRSGRAFE